MIKIETTVKDGSSVTKRDLGNMLKGEWSKTGEAWHKKFRQGHFALTAYGKYGYAPRSKTYSYLKLKKLGHAIPLVLSGASRRLSERKNVIATKKGVTVRMPVRVFNFKSKNSKVDKRKEFTTVIPAEVKELESQFQTGLEKRFRSHRNRKVTKV